MLDLLGKLTRALSWFFIAAAGFGLLAMTAIIGWQVFARYALNDSPAWAEQSALFLMVWFISLAAAAGVREGTHIRMEVTEGAVAPRFRPAVRIACHLVVAAIGIGMAIWGADLVAQTWEFGIPTLAVPRGAAYLPIPVAGALSALFSLEHILAELQGKKVCPLWN